MAELKPGWQRVKFGDVVRLNKETCKNPEAEGIERVIGLEHLEPGDLRIRSWGDVADGTTFTNRVRPGQVLFGKRRAYQRKVAVADFDAICSGDIYVLETANPTLLLPGMVPLICQSDSFLSHAVGTSAGSLSPRTNWKSLRIYEFSLPPLAAQNDIIELMRATDSAIESLRNSDLATKNMVSSLIKATFSENNQWNTISLNELGDVDLGRQKSPQYTQGVAPKPFLKVGNIKDWKIDLSDLEKMDFTGSHLDKYRLNKGDILLTEGDIVSPFNVGRSAMFDGSIDDCCFQNHLIRFRPGAGVLPWFMLGLFRFMHMSGEFARAAKVTTVVSLGAKRVAAMQVRIPPISIQAEVAHKMEKVWQLDSLCAQRIADEKTHRSELLNTCLA